MRAGSLGLSQAGNGNVFTQWGVRKSTRITSSEGWGEPEWHVQNGPQSSELMGKGSELRSAGLDASRDGRDSSCKLT